MSVLYVALRRAGSCGWFASWASSAAGALFDGFSFAGFSAACFGAGLAGFLSAFLSPFAFLSSAIDLLAVRFVETDLAAVVQNAEADAVGLLRHRVPDGDVRHVDRKLLGD